MARKRNSERPGSYVDFRQALTDLQLAREYQGERLTEEELAHQLGVRSVDGRIRGVDLVYACWHASLNPEVQSLPLPKRIQIINSAVGVLEEVDKLWSERAKVPIEKNQ